eukprot:368107-Rhodomonas_salina.1
MVAPGGSRHARPRSRHTVQFRSRHSMVSVTSHPLPLSGWVTSQHGLGHVTYDTALFRTERQATAARNEAVLLLAAYALAMRCTDIAHGVICTRTFHAMSGGTDRAVGLRACYAVSGTEIAYGAARCRYYTHFMEAMVLALRDGGLSPSLPPFLPSSLPPVSYTHLRAHETEADL